MSKDNHNREYRTITEQMGNKAKRVKACTGKGNTKPHSGSNNTDDKKVIADTEPIAVQDKAQVDNGTGGGAWG